MRRTLQLMKIDEVHRIGWLARLAISDREAEQMAKTLSGILALVEQLDGCGLEGVEPLSHPLDIAQRLREDRVTEGDRREAVQAAAPRVAAGFYLVPKVIE